MENDPEFMKPSEVAALFRVDAKTVLRWVKLGRFGVLGTNWTRTPSGRTLLRATHVRTLLERREAQR